MHTAKEKRVPAADESANPTSQGRLEHSSTGQAPANSQPLAGVANRFGATLLTWGVLALVFIALVILKIEEVVHDGWSAFEQEYEP